MTSPILSWPSRSLRFPVWRKVFVSGAERGAVRIRADPARIAAMHVSLEQIRAAVVMHVEFAERLAESWRQSWSIAANDQLFKASDYRSDRSDLAQWRSRAAARRGRGERQRDQYKARRLVQPSAWCRDPRLQAA